MSEWGIRQYCILSSSAIILTDIWHIYTKKYWDILQIFVIGTYSISQKIFPFRLYTSTTNNSEIKTIVWEVAVHLCFHAILKINTAIYESKQHDRTVMIFL